MKDIFSQLSALYCTTFTALYFLKLFHFLGFNQGQPVAPKGQTGLGLSNPGSGQVQPGSGFGVAKSGSMVLGGAGSTFRPSVNQPPPALSSALTSGSGAAKPIATGAGLSTSASANSGLNLNMGTASVPGKSLSTASTVLRESSEKGQESSGEHLFNLSQ